MRPRWAGGQVSLERRSQGQRPLLRGLPATLRPERWTGLGVCHPQGSAGFPSCCASRWKHSHFGTSPLEPVLLDTGVEVGPGWDAVREREGAMMTRVRLAALAAGLLAAVGFGAPVAAQDPPWRVARVSYVNGSVSFRPAGADDWDLVQLNYPLNAGDQLWTDAGSRAELHVGSMAVRLAPDTAFSFLTLDDRFVQMLVNEGTVELRVREVSDDDRYEVDTPNGAVGLLEPGVYRVDVTSDQTRSRVTVRYGRADVSASGSTFAVRQGETAELVGASDPQYYVDSAIPTDAWEQWCSERDRREDYATSARYVSRDLIGYEDLDQYGYWSSVPEYGWVWAPTRVSIGWAPYRDGHWRHVSHWGWTWIDDAPWGFATCHYGRWAWYHSSWIWVPGRMIGRPYYAPALVGFVGGSGWGISLSFGTAPVGWFPLGPGELWVPPYRHSHGYLRDVNVAYVNVNNYNFTNINVNNVRYANLGIDRAVTAVPRDAFVSGRSARVTGVAVPRTQLASAQVLGTTAPVAPETARPESQARRAGIAVPRPPSEATGRGRFAGPAPSGSGAASGSAAPSGNRTGAPGGQSRQRFDNRAAAPADRPGAANRDSRDQAVTPGGSRDPSAWRPAGRPGEAQPRDNAPRSPSAIPRSEGGAGTARPGVAPRTTAPPSETPSQRPPSRPGEAQPGQATPRSPSAAARGEGGTTTGRPAGVTPRGSAPPSAAPSPRAPASGQRGGSSEQPSASFSQAPARSIQRSFESARPPVEFRRPAEPVRPSEAGRPPVEFRRVPEAPRPPVQMAQPSIDSSRRAPEAARPSAPQVQHVSPPAASPRQPAGGAAAARPAPQQSAPSSGHAQAKPRHPGGKN